METLGKGEKYCCPFRGEQDSYERLGVEGNVQVCKVLRHLLCKYLNSYTEETKYGCGLHK